MNFGKRYSNFTVVMALLHGVLIGVAAVAVIGFILMGTGDKKASPKGLEEVPASGPPSEEGIDNKPSAVEPLSMVAKQHGVFSSPAAAASFMTADPLLATAAIIQAGDQYFVWSAVGLTEAEIVLDESSFRKPFLADMAACEVIGAKKLRDVFTTTELAKIKKLESENGDKKTNDFNRNIASITAFTDDLTVIRLHLLSHYSYTKDCVKISF